MLVDGNSHVGWSVPNSGITAAVDVNGETVGGWT